jgi:1,4-alpha-glucan branching enzyme
MSKNGNSKERVTFKLYTPEAGKVSVAGSFNNWDIFSHPMKRNNNGKEDGGWQRAIYLEPGTLDEANKSGINVLRKNKNIA